MAHSAPRYASNEGAIDAVKAAIGGAFVDAVDAVGEVSVSVERASLATALTALRDAGYQQLMEIAGVDYPDRPERFEVCYHLLSVTKNHRLRIKVSTDEATPVPSVTDIWPVAGWLEREVFDMYGVLFEGNTDLRRILTDYGFTGHPQRKDFPLTGYVELRWSETEKRVVYEPVELAQDFRTFDFESPWEGAQYALPGDEKAAEAPGAPTPAPAPASEAPPPKPKTTDTPAETGAGKAANKKAAQKQSAGSPAQRKTNSPAQRKTGKVAPRSPAKPKRKGA